MTRRTYTPEHKANLVLEALQSEGAKWGKQLRAPRQGHCTSQPQPVKAPLLRRAATLCAAAARRLRGQNGAIWSYLVRNNLS